MLIPIILIAFIVLAAAWLLSDRILRQRVFAIIALRRRRRRLGPPRT
jgi:hypothetical protein